MSEESKVTSGEPADIPVEFKQEEKPNDSVSYDSFQKVLSEKKKLQAKLAEAESFRKQKEESELREKEDYKTLLQNKEEEIKRLSETLDQQDKRITNARKLDTFLNTLGSNVDKRYWQLIPLEEVVVDPETKEIDQMSLTKAVENFKKTFPEVMINPNGPKVPISAPSSSKGLSYDEWCRLPLNEMKKRYSEVIKE